MVSTRKPKSSKRATFVSRLTTAEDRREHMLATLACKTAVKAGEPLNREKMGYLVEELFKTSQPALCPHGRPVVVRVEKSVIDKGLGRK